MEELTGSNAGKLKRVPNALRKSLKGLWRSQVKNKPSNALRGT
jgi:hypothetical protein